jgi:tRNA modification GTPase
MRADIESAPTIPVVKISCKTNTGIDELEQFIFDKFALGEVKPDDVFVSGERQKESLVRASEAIARCIGSDAPIDLIAIDLEDVITALGEIMGETVQDEIIDSVFANFCVGK